MIIKHNLKAEIVFILFVALLIGSIFLIGNKDTDQQDNYEDMFDSYEKDTNKEFYFYGFHDDLISDLNKFYNESGEKEFGVCLKGYVLDGNKVFINNYSRHRISDTDSNNNTILFDYCNKEGELGFLHKHPSNSPVPSDDDLYHFFKAFKYHNNTFSIIMYNYDKFEIFTEKNWRHKLNFENCPSYKEELINLWEEI